MKGHIKQSVVEIFTQSPLLALIVNKVEQLSKLNLLVQQKLGPELSTYCRVANLREGILILITTSPATKHLLRFAESDLLTALRAEPDWCHLKSIKIQVQPQQPEVHRVPKTSYPTISLSSPNRELVSKVAENIDSLNLQQALRRLSQKH